MAFIIDDDPRKAPYFVNDQHPWAKNKIDLLCLGVEKRLKYEEATLRERICQISISKRHGLYTLNILSFISTQIANIEHF